MRLKKSIEVEYVVCDICIKELDNYEASHRCVLCGKEVCDKHMGQTTEDGILCLPCFLDGNTIVYDDGCVGVEKEGKGVAAPYL